MFSSTTLRILASTATNNHPVLLAKTSITTQNGVFSKPTTHQRKRLNIDTIQSRLKTMEYAVRGTISIEADRIAAELKKTQHDFPFERIIYTNIGNPHAMGQKPITWTRQVLALLQLPDDMGINHPNAHQLFPSDAIERARSMKAAIGSVGAYSHSKGALAFRQDVANFIERRDGASPGSVNVENIFLTGGASEAITMLMTALIKDQTCGIMTPTPQYPLYSATLDLLGGQKVGYYLDEESAWGLKIHELERSFADAQTKGINVVAMVLINPGNPTGNLLSSDEVKDVVKFCAKHNIVLLSDEVYQANVYRTGDSFFSARRAADELGLIDNDGIQLCSFHSVSKGVYGECGQRGGYVEMVGMDSEVIDVLYKLAASKLCSSVTGQAMVSLMCRGPSPDDVSYQSHEAEKRQIFDGLKERGLAMSKGLDDIPGFSCQLSTGAMYAFPSLRLPTGAIEMSKRMGISPDTLYALDLLKATGICVVPASGFGQKQGRYGFRTTFLSMESVNVVERIRNHYTQFCQKYAS
jgi:aspartate/methionine/tyrosine aminotransferase